jgi:hypothetical protein
MCYSLYEEHAFIYRRSIYQFLLAFYSGFNVVEMVSSVSSDHFVCNRSVRGYIASTFACTSRSHAALKPHVKVQLAARFHFNQL